MWDLCWINFSAEKNLTPKFCSWRKNDKYQACAYCKHFHTFTIGICWFQMVANHQWTNEAATIHGWDDYADHHCDEDSWRGMREAAMIGGRLQHQRQKPTQPMRYKCRCQPCPALQVQCFKIHPCAQHWTTMVKLHYKRCWLAHAIHQNHRFMLNKSYAQNIFRFSCINVVKSFHSKNGFTTHHHQVKVLFTSPHLEISNPIQSTWSTSIWDGVIKLG